MTVIIGIDPHKASHTAVALDVEDQVLGELRVTANRSQTDRLLRFAAPWPERIWAIENANGLGRLLARQLLAAGETVVDVPARLSARVRTLSGAGHKTDAHDARSTAVAARHAKRVRAVVADDDTVLLGLLIERRKHIVTPRQKTLCRIHDQFAKLAPGGVQQHLTATSTAKFLRSIRPSDPIDQQRKTIAKELLAELRVLDRKRKDNQQQLAQALAVHGTTLTGIVGIAEVGAATIIAIVGDVSRFPTAAAFATFNGTAPIAASSGDKVRYRLLNRGGHRELNRVLHAAAKTQRRLPGPGRDYIQRRLDEGKTITEATRALKRHLSNVVYRTMLADQQ
ncbi:MAG TPA: IS110 family transposase, partial [Nitriliruptorales bacterium]